MSDYNNESTHNVRNPEAQKWMDYLETLDDQSISREIYYKIMQSDLVDADKELFRHAYNYCAKLINQGKALDPELFKIYLQEIKGHDISQVNIVKLFMLLGMCGIVFN